MKRPNLFDYAPNELSQDAFLAWLMWWAAPECAAYDRELHECGAAFVRMLLGKEGDAGFRVEKIAVYKQREHVDLWVDVNDDWTLIVEDKVNTREHSSQLERYREIAAKHCAGNERELRCVYLKTGSDTRQTLRQIEGKGYAVVDRRKLLAFFEEHRAENAIYRDYAERLRAVEESEESWRTLPIGEWNKNDELWTGFYRYLDETMDVEGWGKVSNPSGGFLGLWWNFRKWRGCNVYWQIEQERLCLKLGEVEENRQELRDAWTDIVLGHASETGRTEIRRPERTRPGRFMTVAAVERRDWLGADESAVDAETVVARLKEYGAFLDSVPGTQAIN